MDFAAQLSELLNSPAGLAVKGALIASFLDFAIGSFAAMRNGTFALDHFAAFVRKHLLGRVFPIGTLLVAGSLVADGALTAAGLTAAGVYYAETVGSVLASLNPQPELGPRTAHADAIGDPVPTE